MSTIKHYADLDIRGSIIYGKPVTGFPENPRMHEQILKDGVLWMWTTVQGVNTWYPLTNKKNSYVHTQGAAASFWTVNHGMGSIDFVFAVYDDTGTMITPSSVSNVTSDSFRLNFGEDTVGRAVVFFDSELFVPALNSEAINTNVLNVANGTVVANNTGLFISGLRVANLDSNGFIPASVLPSYVDDVIEVASVAALPVTGESGKIYITIDTDPVKTWRWSGSTYAEIAASPGSTDSIAEGSVNLYFTNARAAAVAPVQSVAGRTGAVVLSTTDVSGLSTVASSGSYADLVGKPSLGTAAAKNAPASGNASATEVVLGNDARLTDARPANGGNADTATTLQTARNINGVAFDGSVNITVPAVDTVTPRVASSLVGTPNGVASLDGTGKLPASQLPSGITGAVVYQGAWNASTNSPALASGVGTKGFYYVVSVAGNTPLDGKSNWSVGDQAIFNGTTWDQIQGGSSDVVSVAGRVGVITLSTADVSGLSNSATITATDANTANQIVQRDASGNFAANNITANVTGNVTGTAASVTTAAQPTITSLGTLTSVTSSGVATASAFVPTGSAIPANGMYLSAANTLAWATNSANKLLLSSTGDLTASGNVTAYSDESLKSNWAGLSANFIVRLAGVKMGTFDRVDQVQRQVGVSAQSLQAVLPEAVVSNESGLLSVAYGNAALAAAVALAKEVVSLREEMATMRDQIAALQSK